MPVETLHEAAIVLQGAYQAIEKLLDETEPLQRDLHRSIPQGITSRELMRRWEISGYEAFADACARLKDLLDDPWLDIEKEEGVEAKIA